MVQKYKLCKEHKPLKNILTEDKKTSKVEVKEEKLIKAEIIEIKE